MGLSTAVPNLEFDSWNKRFEQDIFMINSQKRPPSFAEAGQFLDSARQK
jgi:hypothetical protein